MFDAADIAAMIDAFGEAATLYTAGDVRTLQGIFDNDSRPVQLGDLSVASRAPQLTVATGDVEDVVVADGEGDQGSVVTVRGVSYLVSAHHPDGQGFSVLILTEEGSR